MAKIGELSATYYLVDTNGALSQVLAEYDENGSLTTYYTRGEELISQERDGEKHYYLYDGFDSVRILTDVEGNVTDTYTFDAFGNLTASTGDTENDFLYRGEQFDSFTGLYYLHARYMNPSTGTFITMDEYVGSNFEPVSLHKYLYANANPIVYSDPSGYSPEGTLTGQMTAIAVIGILSCTILPNYSKFVNAIGFLLTEISDAFAFAADTIAEWVDGLLNGSKTSVEIANDTKEKAEDDSAGTAAAIPKSRRRNDGCTYYHATSKAIATQLTICSVFGVAMLEGSKWEGGRVFVWKRKPDKKALRLCGALKTEAIIAFESNAHFENDPAFSTNLNPDLSTKDLAYIRKFQPLRSYSPGPISIINVRIVG